MKKFIGLLLAVMMLTGILSTGCVTMMPEAPEALPQTAADSPLHGFTVTETGTIDIIGATTTVYTHDKTGARVFHVSNEDKERAMLVSFETPALDNKGIPHVFEHICASGSQNYPSTNLFLSAIYQTYNTNMNATTYNSMTCYQYATMSEDQLLLIADFYLDSVFYPLLYTDELTFSREAWRYELTDMDSQLNVNGTVYNEMKGAITLSRAASHNLLNTLYPGSVAANNSGGIPADILTLTYEETVAFHQAYYHPSNVIVYLYGDLEIEAFLELIGSYCDEFERQDVYVEKGLVEPFTEPVVATFEFPMEKSSAAEDNTIISYAVNLGHLSPETFGAFDMLSMVIANDSSPLKQKLREALPKGNFGVSFNPSTAGQFLAVTGTGLNPEDMDTMKAAVDAAITEILTNGFDIDLLEATIASEEFYVLMMGDETGVGLNTITVLAWLGSTGAGYNYYNDYIKALEITKERYTEGYFEELIATHIVGNPHTVLVSTVPVPGQKEAEEEAFRAVLDEIQANMTDEEKQAIIAMNEALTAMAAAEVPVELLDRLTVVTVETLPVELKSYEVTETEIDGVRTLLSEAAVAGVGYTIVDYNSAAVSVDELHYMYLYANLLGNVRTENYDLPTLQTKMTRYLNGFSASSGSREFFDFSFQPIFTAQWYSLNDDYADAAALVREIIFNTDLTDIETIKGIIGRLKNSQRSSINGSPHNVMYTRAMANRFDRYAYNDYMRGVSYYAFLNEAAVMIEEDPEAFIAKIAAVRDKISYKDNSVLLFTGNAEGIEIFKESASILTEVLTDDEVPVADLSVIPRPSDAEALIIESAVQYNTVFATLDEIGLEYSGKLLPLASIIADQYLIPEVRHTLGAYGCFAVIDRHGVAFISYRDPNVTATFNAYEGIGDFALNNSLTQDDIDRYIISSFSTEAAPVGELSGALNYALYRYLQYPEDYFVNNLEAMKTSSVADLTELAEYLTKATEVGLRSTAGSEAAINENAGLYDTIDYAFGAPTGDEPEEITRLQVLEDIFGTTREDLYDLCVSYGYILDIAEPGDFMTKEEFAYVLMVVFQGTLEEGAPEVTDIAEASEYAQEYIIMALSNGLLDIDDDGNFNPKELVTFEYYNWVMGVLQSLLQ